MALRDLTSQLQSDVESTITNPNVLVRLTDGTTTKRYASSEVTYQADFYPTRGVKVRMDAKNGVTSCAVDLHDADGDVRGFLQTANLADVTLEVFFGVHQVAASPVTLYKGLVSRVRYNPGMTVVQGQEDPILFPSQFITAEEGFTDLNPAGTYEFPSGTLVIRRDS